MCTLTAQVERCTPMPVASRELVSYGHTSRSAAAREPPPCARTNPGTVAPARIAVARRLNSRRLSMLGHLFSFVPIYGTTGSADTRRDIDIKRRVSTYDWLPCPPGARRALLALRRAALPGSRQQSSRAPY